MSLIALAFAAALTGQDPEWPAVCVDDEESAACDAALRTQLLEMFDATPIEAEAASGAQVYRAFFANGYGRDMLLVSFEMKPDMPPMVVVSGRDGKRLTHPADVDTWERVADEAVHADRDVSPLPESPDGDVRICIHPWSAAIEMANALDFNRDRPAVRSKVEGGCEPGGLAIRFGFLLADQAVRTIPACDQLEPDNHRNDVSRLEACLILAGNTVAAADLMNQKGEPPFGVVGEAEWRDWLSMTETAEIDWTDEAYPQTPPSQGATPVLISEFLAGRFAALGGVTITQTQVGARLPTEGWIVGRIGFHGPGGGSVRDPMVADYRQDWTRTGIVWRLAKWTIGPFRPLDPVE